MSSSSITKTDLAHQPYSPKNSFQFLRPIPIHGHLQQLMMERRLNGKDLLLVIVIGELVRPEGENPGLGCYASNIYLGDAINAHPASISRRLLKLKHLDLLVEVHMGGQRYLELKWSRTKRELQEVSGLYGELLRQAHGVKGKDLKTMPYKEYLKTDHWKRVRKEALQRAKYRCQLCNRNDIQLNTHHRTYERRGEELPEDLTVLCRLCHEKFHDVLPKE